MNEVLDEAEPDERMLAGVPRPPASAEMLLALGVIRPKCEERLWFAKLNQLGQSILSHDKITLLVVFLAVLLVGFRQQRARRHTGRSGRGGANGANGVDGPRRGVETGRLALLLRLLLLRRALRLCNMVKVESSTVKLTSSAMSDI